MRREEMLKKLESLAQLDTDAVGVYSEALEHPVDDDVRGNFGMFLDDHMRHAERWTDIIEQISGVRPRLHIDLTGRMAEWMTALRARRGTEGALHALETAERYHVSRYREASEWGLEEHDVQLIINGFYEDEQAHLAYVQERLRAPVG